MSTNHSDRQSYLSRLGFVVPTQPGLPGEDQDPSSPGPARAIWADQTRRFAGSHVKVLSAMALAAVIFATWMVMQARSVSLDEPEPTPSWTAPAPSPTPELWMIHVLGAVARPGVVTVPGSSRVIDAIESAGGLTGDADPADLNLAAVLADGCQILIGTKAEPRGEVRHGTAGSSPDSAGGPAGAAKVNLNQASQAQLETLPSVGPATAQAILAWRQQNGQFSSLSQLLQVDGIGQKTYAKIEPYVCV